MALLVIFIIHLMMRILFPYLLGSFLPVFGILMTFAAQMLHRLRGLKSVDFAPVSFTIRIRISGFSSIGHGRK